MNESIEYRHSKTGNIYEYLSDVFPTTEVPKDYTMTLSATCSETQQKLAIYFSNDIWYFLVSGKTYAPDVAHVLYTRSDVLWVRPRDMFHELVSIDGVMKPRFEKVAD